jgi:hypothetical protein
MPANGHDVLASNCCLQEQEHAETVADAQAGSSSGQLSDLQQQQQAHSIQPTGLQRQQQQQHREALQQKHQQRSSRGWSDKAEELVRQETAGVSEADVQVGICDGSSSGSSSSSGGGAKPAAASTAAAAAGGAAGLLQELRAPSFGRVLRALPYEVITMLEVLCIITCVQGFGLEHAVHAYLLSQLYTCAG